MSEGDCNPICMYTHTLFKFAVLSKDQAGFPNETFFLQLCVHGKICWFSFSSYYKNLFLFINFFFFFFFIFSYFVNLTSLMHSHTEQCFYYKNYTSLLKKVFNIKISVTNSFKNFKTKRQSYWISDDITWLQNFHGAFIIKLFQKITMLSVMIIVTYGYM